MIWFTSDLHIGHQSIISHAYRPFDTIQQMNDSLMGAINDRVSWTDELWILGDFSHRIPQEEVARYRERINCRTVYLVRGNHDTHFAKGACPFQKDVYYYEDLRAEALNRRRIVLFHYPITDWNDMNRGSIHLHGHIHAKAKYNDRNRANGRLSYDVGVDANGFAPVSMDDIVAFFDGVEPKGIHHRHRK